MSRPLSQDELAAVRRNEEEARARLLERMRGGATNSLLPPRQGGAPASQAPSQASQAHSSQVSQPRMQTTKRVILQMHSAFTFSTLQNSDLAATVYNRVPGACYVPAESLWTFPLSQYEALLQRLSEAGVAMQPHDLIPAPVLALFRGTLSAELPQKGANKRPQKGPQQRAQDAAACDAHDANGKGTREHIAKRPCTPNLAAHDPCPDRYADTDSPVGHDDLGVSSSFAKQISADAKNCVNGNSSSTLPNSAEDGELDRRIGEEDLAKALFPFQREAVADIVLRRGGRVLLADDMGLGKSVQALAVACCFRGDWPLLIVSPASMVGSWAEQMARWVPSVHARDISVVYEAKRGFSRDALVVIASYDISARVLGDSRSETAFGVVIADECHALKNTQTKRSSALLPVLARAKRAILLSGTPATSRPVELFAQIRAVEPRLFPAAQAFGMRYCAGHRGRFGWDFRGASNLRELNLVLERSVMIRRTKDAVLTQLPRKMRHQVFLGVGRAELEAYRRSAAAERTRELWEAGMLEEDAEGARSSGAEAMEIWRQTAEVKLPAALAYIDDLIEAGHKMLLFGHHQSVLDGLERHLLEKSVRCMRIDGRTPPNRRADLCNMFQHEAGVRAAVLSITAASTGLTLTAATTVVFAELFWNPGMLLQAEDRAHRIGQRDCVAVHYLLARGTADDRLWPLLLRKLTTLEAVGLGRNDFAAMPTTGAQAGGLQQRTLDSFFGTARRAAKAPEMAVIHQKPLSNSMMPKPVVPPAANDHENDPVDDFDVPEDISFDDIDV